MKLRKLILAPAAAAVMALAAPAIAATNSLTFQGVTFETTVIDSDTLGFSILGADTLASGNWTGINYLWAFEIKNIGNVTSATISPGNLTPLDNALGAKGCESGGTTGSCFEAPTPIALTDSMSWTIDFVGTGLNLYGIDAGTDALDFGVIGPHVKVNFLTDLVKDVCSGNPTTCTYDKTGDLLSLNLAPVPEPEIYAMMAAGLGLMGFVARRRQRQAAA